MFDLFATPEMRDARQKLEARFADDPNALLKDCQAEWERVEALAKVCFFEATAHLDRIRETVGEIASCFRALSLSLPVPQSLFRVSPDEKVLLNVAQAVSKLQKSKQKSDELFCFLQKDMDLHRELEQDLHAVVTLCATASEFLYAQEGYGAFTALFRGAEEQRSLCARRISTLAEVSLCLMRFSSESLLEYRNALLSAADFAERGKRGDLALLRRRAGEIAFSVGEFQAKIPHFDHPPEVS